MPGAWNIPDRRRRGTDRSERDAFTLVELMIVIVVIGILATVVIPQFSSASQEARENSLKDDLRYIRCQIQVYRAQHRDVAPGKTGDFRQQMTRYTDESGNTSGTPTSTHKFGPYVTGFPRNPLNGLDTVEIVTAGPLTAAVDGSHGWIYNPDTGEFIADSTGSDSSGIAYGSY